MHVAIDINDARGKAKNALQSQGDNRALAEAEREAWSQGLLYRPEARVARLWPKPRERP